jgi:hypothetical protein
MDHALTARFYGGLMKDSIIQTVVAVFALLFFGFVVYSWFASFQTIKPVEEGNYTECFRFNKHTQAWVHEPCELRDNGQYNDQ